MNSSVKKEERVYDGAKYWVADSDDEVEPEGGYKEDIAEFFRHADAKSYSSNRDKYSVKKKKKIEEITTRRQQEPEVRRRSISLNTFINSLISYFVY